MSSKNKALIVAPPKKQEYQQIENHRLAIHKNSTKYLNKTIYFDNPNALLISTIQIKQYSSY